MLSACFWFSLMATLIRYISKDVPPFEMVFFRNLFSVFLLLPWAIKNKIGMLHTKRWNLYGLRAISGVTGMCMLFYSLTIVPLTEAISLTFTVPLFTTIMAVILLKEKVNLQRWAAIAIGFLGVLVILRPGSDTFQYGSLLVVATTFFWSISNILVKKLTKTDNFKVIVFYMVMIMTPISLPIALTNWQTPDLRQLLLMLLLAFITNQAQFAMTKSYSKADMNVVLPFDFSRLIFITIFAYIFFGEVIDIYSAIGAVIIFSSSLYVAKKEASKNRQIL